MVFDTERIRAAEWLIGLASLLLLIDLFVLPWYGLNGTFGPTAAALGQSTTATGWSALLVLGPIALVAGLLGVWLWWVQATRSAPALPVALTLVEFGLAGALLIAFVVRVVFSPPNVLIPGAPGVNSIDSLFGAYAGLFLTVLITAGCYVSLRVDGIAAADAPQDIEVLRLTPRH